MHCFLTLAACRKFLTSAETRYDRIWCGGRCGSVEIWVRRSLSNFSAQGAECLVR